MRSFDFFLDIPSPLFSHCSNQTLTAMPEKGQKQHKKKQADPAESGVSDELRFHAPSPALSNANKNWY
jgi:hypothetical protein